MTYKPGDQPDPAFTAFFSGDWQKLLERVVIPGTDGQVSWDRKAAFITWKLMNEGHGYDFGNVCELLGLPYYVQQAGRGTRETPIDWAKVTHVPSGGWEPPSKLLKPNPIAEHAFSHPSTRGQSAEPVGTQKLAKALTILLNHGVTTGKSWADDDCTPTPGGVPLEFNSKDHP